MKHIQTIIKNGNLVVCFTTLMIIGTFLYRQIMVNTISDLHKITNSTDYNTSYAFDRRKRNCSDSPISLGKGTQTFILQIHLRTKQNYHALNGLFFLYKT